MEASEPLISPNTELLAVIKQLPHLRRVCLVSYHRTHDGPFPQVITAFVTGLQKESDIALPHLGTVSVWAPGAEPWSHTWRKRHVDSNGKNRAGWFNVINEIVNPDRVLLGQHL